MKSKKYEIFLITGGTAGHIIPAINFSNYLKRNNISNLIMTDNRGLKYFDNKEYDYRIIIGANPDIQLTALLAEISNIRNK